MILFFHWITDIWRDLVTRYYWIYISETRENSFHWYFSIFPCLNSTAAARLLICERQHADLRHALGLRYRRRCAWADSPIALKHGEMENTNKRFFRAFRIVVITAIDIYRVTYHASNICLQKIFLRLFTWAVGKNRVTVRKKSYGSH